IGYVRLRELQGNNARVERISDAITGAGRPNILFGADSVATTKFVGCSHRKRSRYAPVLAGRYLRWASEFTPEFERRLYPPLRPTRISWPATKFDLDPMDFRGKVPPKFSARGLMRPRCCHRIYARIRWSFPVL